MNDLTITSTKILHIENGYGGCVAIAQLVLNDAIKLTGIKMFDTNGKRFISYPRNMSNRQKKSYYYPLNNEVGNMISDRLWNDFDVGNKEQA